MDIRVGPSFRTYTIIQAALIAGLVGVMVSRISPTRAILVIFLIAAISFAICFLSWSGKNQVLPVATYVFGITAVASLLIPMVNHPIIAKVAGQLGEIRGIDAALLVAIMLIVFGGGIAGPGGLVLSMVKNFLPQGWRTPLWGGQDGRKVIPPRRAS